MGNSDKGIYLLQSFTATYHHFPFLLFLLTVLLSPLYCLADNNGDSWELYLQELYENSEDGAISMEEAYEHLTELSQQPLDINSAEVEELKRIPGLDTEQISDIIEYREKYGNMQSITELALIPSIDNRMREYLNNFLFVAKPKTDYWYSPANLKSSLRYLKHSITISASIPTYYRAGDTALASAKGNKYAGRYLGDPTKHSMRYSMKLGSHAAFNFTGAKTAAEPFGCNGNSLGYDTYAYNLTVNKLGIFRKIILGQFRAQFGMGLLLNTNFTLGKQAFTASAGRQTSSFSPHSSASDAKHFQGAAATADIGLLRLSAFASYRYIDATLNNDGSISTILTSGYHRTQNEMEKKNNSSVFTSGVHLQHSGSTIQHTLRYNIGASVIFSHFNRSLNPTFSKADTVSAARLYRLHHPHGSSFCNASVDYMLRWRHLILNGETAINEKGTLATINTLSWRTSERLSLAAIQRYYSYRYYSLYGSAFADGGSVQNESGLYLTAKWQAFSRLSIETYTDVAYFPWLKYRISSSSYSLDNCVTAKYSMSNWFFTMRYRAHSRQRDFTDSSSGKKSLIWRTDQRIRLAAEMKHTHWNTRSVVEGCFFSFDSNSKGIIASQSITYNPSAQWGFYVMGAYFHTDDYNSRLYAYERSTSYSFGYSSYYGNGLRLALMAKAELLPWLTMQLKGGHTHYFDRDTIGTAERQIFSCHQTDIDLQVKVRL